MSCLVRSASLLGGAGQAGSPLSPGSVGGGIAAIPSAVEAFLSEVEEFRTLGTGSSTLEVVLGCLCGRACFTRRGENTGLGVRRGLGL